MNEATETASSSKIKFAEKSSEGTVVSIKFGNGATLSCDVSTLDQEIQMELMIHGALQKIGDSYAGAAGDYGFAETAAGKVIENLVAGLWKSAREGGEGKPRTTELAEAVARIKGMDLPAAVEVVSALSDEQRKALRGKDKVKSVIAQIRYEKASKKAESSDEDLGL